MADEMMNQAQAQAAPAEDVFADLHAGVPTLSFDTEPQAAAVQEAPKPQTVVEPEANLLSEEEMRQVDAFVDQIDVTNSKAILN